jgi:hypothetical protein
LLASIGVVDTSVVDTSVVDTTVVDTTHDYAMCRMIIL